MKICVCVKHVYPKFPDIMKAKKKIKKMELGDLGIEALEPVPERAGAKMFEGGADEQVI